MIFASTQQSLTRDCRGPQASSLFHIDGNLADRSRQRHSASNKFDPHASSGTGQLEIRRLWRGWRVELQRSLPGSPQNGLMHWYSGPRRLTGGGCSNQAIAQATVASNGAQQDRFELAPRASALRGAGPHAPCPIRSGHQSCSVHVVRTFDPWRIGTDCRHGEEARSPHRRRSLTCNQQRGNGYTSLMQCPGLSPVARPGFHQVPFREWHPGNQPPWRARRCTSSFSMTAESQAESSFA